MAIESKNLLVWVKAMSRGQALPLDASEIYGSFADAQTYAASATAYAGQTIKALMEDGKYHSYVLQPSEAGYTLEEVGAIKASDLKQYVMVVESLPTSGQEQGILYINSADSTGSIWTGTEWKEVFRDVQPTLDEMNEAIESLEADMADKAPIANPNFTGSVTVEGEAIALKSYVDGLVGTLVSCAPGVVDSTNALPTVDYKAGQTFRVAEAGTYAGQACEIGDLIICLKDYAADSAFDSDFMVVQANVDGAVTSKADAVVDGEIVVFDGVTGKVIKSSAVSIASLNDAIAKAHEHENKAVLDTYDKTQTELLAAAKAEAAADAQALVDAHISAVDEALALKADKSELIDAYSKSEVDALLSPITSNLNTKVDAATVDSKIAESKTETLEEAAAALNEKIGDLGDQPTVVAYVDDKVSDLIISSGDTNLEAAKSYTDTQIAASETTVKSYADTQDATNLEAAKAYTDEQIGEALTVVEF